MSRETLRLAREMVRAELMAKRAAARYLWDEVDTWLEARDALRQERSTIMRAQMLNGEWWPAKRKDAA